MSKNKQRTEQFHEKQPANQQPTEQQQSASEQVTIYHNPNCGTSRNTLALIQNAGLQPQVIEYLQNPPTLAQLSTLIHAAGISVMDAIRKNVEPFEQLQIAKQAYSDAELLALMVQHPLLINRPFVVAGKGTRLCRPSEVVLEILATPQQGAFFKEDGVQLVDAQGQRIQSS